MQKKEAKLTNGKLMECCVKDFNIKLNFDYYSPSNLVFPLCKEHEEEFEIQVQKNREKYYIESTKAREYVNSLLAKENYHSIY